MEDFWDQIDWASMVQNVVFAIVILVVTWIVATLVKTLFARLTTKVPALQGDGGSGDTLGASLGQVASLLVWLFGLIAVLQVFALGQVLAPIQGLLNGIFEFLPNIIGAGFVFFVGALVAKIVRQLIHTALTALPYERWLSTANAKAGEATGTGGTRVDTDRQGSLARTLPTTLATVVYGLIMLLVAIAALQVLGIESISRPAEQMLQTIFDAVPSIVAALVLLGIGVAIARFVGGILEQLLVGAGTDRALREIQVLPEDKEASPVIAKVAQVGIALFFAVAAVQLLGFPQLTIILSEVLELGGRVLFGGVIVVAGVFIANLVSGFLSGHASTFIRYAIIVLFAAMGLNYMGVANRIIELGFGALVVGGALAAALAFGLGGREAAARQLEQFRQGTGSGTGGSAT
ncbi:mechanosensitive ion channel [Nocardioides panacisoli]|uniref:mechanosensitive ion channel n=1 Tax=Nocardioides panacisoli TaxID=627624 RepID=UPI001C6302FF|nr:mechanosensitive ion channel [Nocardioides panacisoli]QYJ03887.1 mechanosensitive ion channel [Nocardioides panacisoli]